MWLLTNIFMNSIIIVLLLTCTLTCSLSIEPHRSVFCGGGLQFDYPIHSFCCSDVVTRAPVFCYCCFNMATKRLAIKRLSTRISLQYGVLKL